MVNDHARDLRKNERNAYLVNSGRGRLSHECPAKYGEFGTIGNGDRPVLSVQPNRARRTPACRERLLSVLEKGMWDSSQMAQGERTFRNS